jgi:hypothetical protein
MRGLRTRPGISKARFLPRTVPPREVGAGARISTEGRADGRGSVRLAAGAGVLERAGATAPVVGLFAVGFGFGAAAVSGRLGIFD